MLFVAAISSSFLIISLNERNSAPPGPVDKVDIALVTPSSLLEGGQVKLKY